MDIREEVARIHGIPDLADQLHGETAAELHAFAAAVASLRKRDQQQGELDHTNAAELVALGQLEREDIAAAALFGWSGTPETDAD